MLRLLVAGVGRLLGVSGRGSHGPVYTADEVAADLPGWIQSYAIYSHLNVGTVTCDSPPANIGDTSICNVEVVSGTDSGGDDMTGHWGFEVTLQDKAGHIRFSLDGQLAN